MIKINPLPAVFQTDFIQIVHMSEFYARKHNPLLENRLFRFGGE